MARFHELSVTGVEMTIKDAVVVTLQPVNGGDFEFTQGQYLTFRRDFDGIEIRRSYSICVERGAPHLQVGIKKVDGGAFSTWANTELKVGQVLEAMSPAGNFHAALEPEKAKNYIGFAGGSGITPVLSILRTVMAEEPHSTFTLVYANRGVNTIMFREELEDLKNQHMGRLTVIHVLEQDSQDIDLFTGRVTKEKCAALFEHWVSIEEVDTAFICGPEPMMLGIAGALRDHGLSDDQIKFELFASAQPGKLKRPTRGTVDDAASQTYELTVTIDGATRTMKVDKDTTLLDAALENSLDAPFSCKAGVCSTCMCRVEEGAVEMATNHALEDYEVDRGYVLSCQSFPTTDKVVIDYDGGH
ncbi:2Fe-2S iron-sulfur cluster-binding protein [uncultured Ruegeria sp.]|uniref:2Fe-2S iron-sulfur cluster-binding protein n=1 Tax=uncultured Ruegeria sp. TaxID=259304 RepID=UPI0026031A11|nr:2Fe-2S iron-sulfur cluster-binding protein [uncultured Ruegeria sp.]